MIALTTCRVILVEPKGKDLGPCLRSGERLWPNPPRLLRTVAEGIRTQQMGSITFPIVCRHAEKGAQRFKCLASSISISS